MRPAYEDAYPGDDADTDANVLPAPPPGYDAAAAQRALVDALSPATRTALGVLSPSAQNARRAPLPAAGDALAAYLAARPPFATPVAAMHHINSVHHASFRDVRMALTEGALQRVDYGAHRPHARLVDAMAAYGLHHYTAAEMTRGAGGIDDDDIENIVPAAPSPSCYYFYWALPLLLELTLAADGRHVRYWRFISLV
jgi:hypothetical protein